MDPKQFDWRKWFAVVLVSLVTGLGGGATVAPLCSPATCQCCLRPDTNGEVKLPGGILYLPHSDANAPLCRCAGECCRCAKE